MTDAGPSNPPPSDGSYQLVNVGESCDICQSAAGPYPSRPDVPLHRNCDCVAQGPPTGGDNCSIEYRNFRSSYAQSVTELQLGQEFGTCGNDVLFTLDLEVSLSDVGYDALDADIEAAAVENGWTRPPDPVSVLVDLQPNTKSMVTIRADMGSWIFLADKWELCVVEDPVAGTHLIETFVGPIGGSIEAPVGGTGTVQSRSCDDAGPPEQPEPDDGAGDGAGDDGVPGVDDGRIETV